MKYPCVTLGGIAYGLAALLLGGGYLSAQTNAEPKILFLHVKLTSNNVALVESSVRPGVAKPQLNPDGKEIQIELVSAEGKIIWTGAADDPRVQHVEFEDPPQSGRLRRRTIYLNEAEMTIRVPFVAEARRIDFYASGPSSPKGEDDKRLARELLGSIPLPPATGNKP